MPEFSVSRLMQMLRDMPGHHPKDDFSDQSVQERLSKGAYYLWIHVVRPLLSGKSVATNDIDFSAFSYGGLEEIGLYYVQYRHDLNAECQKAEIIWSGLRKASPQNTSVSYV